MKIGMYPGSFDPITLGHLDIIERAAKLFDKLYIAVSFNINKKYLLDQKTRFNLVKETVKHLDNVIVVEANDLTVKECNKYNCKFIVRGLRALSDFDYEFQLTSVNRKLDETIDSVFIMTDTKYSFLSSSMISVTVIIEKRFTRS